jgi:hypothetical protein
MERAVVLVEGVSDQWALEALAARRGRDLGAEGVAIVAMGGITNTHRFLAHYGPAGLDVRVAGLYDAREKTHVARALERAGLGVGLGAEALAERGFFGCDADLEDELIRALGVERVEAVIAAAGDLRSLRLLQGMPAQRGRPDEAVLHRFMGVRSGRKRVYARLLVEALDPRAVPAPLDAVLAAV